MQFVTTRYARRCIAEPIEVGGVCDSARGDSYVEETLHAVHAVHAVADGNELWNYTHVTVLQRCAETRGDAVRSIIAMRMRCLSSRAVVLLRAPLPGFRLA